MSLGWERIEAEALALSRRDRAALAHRLIVSLDEGEEEDPTDVELAWEGEIKHRLAEHREGKMQTTSASEVFAKARSLLKQRRGS